MATDKDEAWKKIKDGAKAAMDMAGQTAREWKDEAEKTAKTLSEPGNSPKKKAAWKKIGMGVGLVAIIIILASLLAGPSLSCDDSDVKDMVGSLVREQIEKVAGNLAELAMIFEDPNTLEMQKDLKQLKNMKVSVNEVRELSMNTKAKRCSCAADISISLGNQKVNQQVRYQVSDTDKGMYVEIDPVSLFTRQ